jgi:carbon-monoxide dehydrogenase iron sulfur subunit
MRRVYAREEVCISCRLCEIGCAVEHSQSKRIVTAMRFEDPKPVSRVRVEQDGPRSFALQCRHCDEPRCAQSCLTQALRRGDDGIVRYDPEACIACYTCMLACPNGAISRVSTPTWKGIAKCDLCPDREVPACVAMCPNEALLYGSEREWQQFLAAHASPAPLVAAAAGGRHG